MKLRKALPADRAQIDALYARARQFMKENGNPDQWKECRPLPEATDQDLACGNLYVLEDQGILRGVFALIIGTDPTYQTIYQGNWPESGEYCTIHRIASLPGSRLFELALSLAAASGRALRIDTHEDNSVMRHLFEKHGISHCGIIITDDGTERLAFFRRFSREEQQHAKTNPFLSGLI